MTKERQVFNVDTGRLEMMKFLRLEQNNFYNNSMGDVDVSDQLRNQYRFDHWLRMRKWWWSILLWWVGVMLVNAYIFYKRINKENGVDPSQLVSHHDFQKAIAFAWINPEKHWSSPGRGMKIGKKRKQSPKSGDSSQRGSAKRTRTSPSESSQQTKGGVKHRVRFNDNTLAQHGALCMRLNRGFTHWPMEVTNRTRCGLHRWCGFEKFQSVVQCEDCEVPLCIRCYQLFHKTVDLVGEKSSLQATFTQEWSLKPEPNNKKKSSSTR
jgi:hypothetical protein